MSHLGIPPENPAARGNPIDLFLTAPHDIACGRWMCSNIRESGKGPLLVKCPPAHVHLSFVRDYDYYSASPAA